MPSWTFVATAHAAVAAGLEPFFLDVDESGVLTAEAVRAALPGLPEAPAAVVVVAPFGWPLDPAPWERFRDDTKVAVVFDAAAGFDGLRAGPVPAVVSLHATKAPAAGEGGVLVAADTALVAECRQRSAFGFRGDRQAWGPGTNAKMSEYAAAVALASLDGWNDLRARLLAAARRYRRLAPPSLGFLPGFGEDWISTTCVAVAASGDARPVEEACERARIATRRWWEGGCHTQPAFRHCRRLPLPVTGRLARAWLGLPFSVDLEEEDWQRIAAVLGAV